MSNRPGGIHPRVLNGAIVVVFVTWIVSLILDATNIWPEPPDTIGLAFMAVLGPLIGIWAARVAAAPAPENIERRVANQLDDEHETSEAP